jgi:hypothetical protein
MAMELNRKVEKLKEILKDKNCTVEKHSSVMEITFSQEEDAHWFENIFDNYQRESAVSCLMSMRGANDRYKFVFNVKDMDQFINLLEKSKDS